MAQQITRRDRAELDAAMTALDIRRPHILPARVVYTTTGGVIPDVPPSPDVLAPVPLHVVTSAKSGRFNGLTTRADSMARFLAHGATVSDSFRVAYRRKGKPRDISTWASKVTRSPRFQAALGWYRSQVEQQGRQQTIAVRDYVMSRLVAESQDADSSASRIRALELLGKTEGMFVDVKRTERTLDPAQLESLKAQLYQRLTDVMGRLGMVTSQSTGTALGPTEREGTGTLSPTEGENPFFAGGPGPIHADTIPPTQSPNSGGGGVGTPSSGLRAAKRHMDTPQVTDIDEFSGPLILLGGLSDVHPDPDRKP